MATLNGDVSFTGYVLNVSKQVSETTSDWRHHTEHHLINEH